MKSIKDLKLKLTTPKEKEIYERIILQPSRLEGYKHLARLLAKEDDQAAAEKVLRLALALFPKDRLTREQLATLFEEMGSPARAMNIYRQLIKEGKSWSAYLRLARILKKKGDLEGAVGVFKSISARSPFKERTFIPLYDLYFIMGSHKRGINNMKQAIKFSGANSRLLKKLGRLCMKDGQTQEGIKYLKQALRYDRNDLDTVKLIGLSNRYLGHYGIAKNWFFKIL